MPRWPIDLDEPAVFLVIGDLVRAEIGRSPMAVHQRAGVIFDEHSSLARRPRCWTSHPRILFSIAPIARCEPAEIMTLHKRQVEPVDNQRL